ncbi:MAG: tetratricopeptide repeat protein [Syntrophorhabdales bacterium]|jgi:tetratricopeptide (TPR) repeat protein
MRKIFCAGLLALLVASLGCSTAYQTYRADVWGGRRLLDRGEYGQAREDFIKASRAQPDEPAAYALAATASYKMNDIDAASRLIGEAARRDSRGDAHVRILGYRALILLKQGKENAGLDALHDYIAAYQHEYGPQNVRQVEGMWRRREVDMVSLERFLDDEIRIYEADMDQFRRSGTGWFAQRYGTPTPSIRD